MSKLDTTATLPDESSLPIKEGTSNIPGNDVDMQEGKFILMYSFQINLRNVKIRYHGDVAGRQ